MKQQLFSTSRERRRTAKPWVVSAAAHVGLLCALAFIPSSDRGRQPAGEHSPELPSQIVWLSAPGPGGGGGGGGNRSADPPQHAQLRGRDQLTVPVAPSRAAEDREITRDPTQNLEIPAQTLASADLGMTGVLESEPAGTSRGSGVGPGAGTGSGAGIGPGDGAGLGDGPQRGTGGDVYRPGGGVTPPTALYRAQPRYTSAAMRRRIQGAVLVECVVDTKGTCSRPRLLRSLDPTFGLDEQALQAAAEWTFLPGRRLGEPVPVLVTIELGFTIH